MLERASIAGGATIAVFLVVILCFVVYLHYKRKTKSSSSETDIDCVDGRRIQHVRQPTFGTRWRTKPQSDLPVAVHEAGGDANSNIRAELHQVTTLLPTPPPEEFSRQWFFLPLFFFFLLSLTMRKEEKYVYVQNNGT